jgi:fructose-bisphosphate aldolase class II
MAMVSMRQLLDEAAAGGYGVGAFNVNDRGQIRRTWGVPVEEIQPGISYLKRARAAMQRVIDAGARA